MSSIKTASCCIFWYWTAKLEMNFIKEDAVRALATKHAKFDVTLLPLWLLAGILIKTYTHTHARTHTHTHVHTATTRRCRYSPLEWTANLLGRGGEGGQRPVCQLFVAPHRSSGCFAHTALVLFTSVLAETTTPTRSANCSPTIVLADLGAPARLARAALSIVHTNAWPPTLLAPMPAAAVLAHLCATAGETLAPLAHLFAEALVARQVAPRKKAQLARRNSLSLNSHSIELSRSCDLVVWCSVGQSQCAVALKETRIYTRQTDRRRRMLHCNTWRARRIQMD